MKAYVRLEVFGLLDSWETCPGLKVSKIVITNNLLVQGPLEGYVLDKALMSFFDVYYDVTKFEANHNTLTKSI